VQSRKIIIPPILLLTLFDVMEQANEEIETPENFYDSDGY